MEGGTNKFNATYFRVKTSARLRLKILEDFNWQHYLETDPK